MGGSIFTSLSSRLVLLTWPNLCTIKDIRASISEEYYFYLSNRIEAAHKKELSEFDYFTHLSSIILAFSDSGQGEVSLLEHLRKEIKVV